MYRSKQLEIYRRYEVARLRALIFGNIESTVGSSVALFHNVPRTLLMARMWRFTAHLYNV